MLKNVRLQGAIFLVMGIAIAAFIWDYAVTQAKAHAETITASSLIAFFPAFAMLGLAIILFGEKVKIYSKGLKGRDKTAKDFFLIGIILLPGFVMYFALRNRIEQLGYRF